VEFHTSTLIRDADEQGKAGTPFGMQAKAAFFGYKSLSAQVGRFP
jgi:hypothetical protein